MNSLSNPIWINPTYISTREIASKDKASIILGILRINNEGRFTSGKTSHEIVQEFDCIFGGLSESEKWDFLSELDSLNLGIDIRQHIESIMSK